MPRNTLTLEQIVRTAIEILDAEGLDGFNLRILGSRLDSAPTAVYWHVKSKDNLVRLAGDEIWQEVELPDLDALDWRTAAATMATGIHAMMTRHPWLVQALASHLLYGPAKARCDDHLLAIYEQGGFTGAAADQAAAAVFTYVLGNAVGAATTVSLNRRLRRDGGDPGPCCATRWPRRPRSPSSSRGCGPGSVRRPPPSTWPRRSRRSSSA